MLINKNVTGKNTSKVLSLRMLIALIGVTLLASEVAAQTEHGAAAPKRERLAVAWNDTDSGTGRVRLMTTHEPWELVTPPLETGPNPIVRFARARLLVLSRGSGTVSVVDPSAWSVLDTFELGAASQLQDIALADPQRAYLTRAGATHLLRLDLLTGQTSEVIDLSPYADADGIPDLGMMAVHEGRLFVQIRRVDSISPSQSTLRSYLAVVDLASEQLIDVDPVTPGVQAIELQGTPPKFKMQVVRETRQLFVGATGDFWDAGGIEMIDLDGLQSQGLGVSEADGQTGVDLGAFVMVTPMRGFLAFSTDFATSSHLSMFTLFGSVEPVPDYYVALGYFAPALAYAPVADRIFFPDAGYSPTGVQVFDPQTGERLTNLPVATSGPPTDLELLYIQHQQASPELRR